MAPTLERFTQRNEKEKMIIGIAKGLAGGAALSGIAKAIHGLYGMTGSINAFFDIHIDRMKASDNSTVSQTGRVIESAKFGFGMGYMSSVVIVAAGQYLLGNTLAAVGTVATAVALTNPIAMTCAAVGAIYYGWSALSEKERDAILNKLTKGLEIGVELIKSIIQFLISKTKELVSAKSIADFKSYIKTYAGRFGKSLYDVTGKMADLVVGAAEMVGEITVRAGNLTVAAAGSTTTALKLAMDKTGEAASSAASTTSSALKVAYDKTGEATSSIADSTSSALKDAYDRTGDAASSLGHSTKQALGWKTGNDASQVNPKRPV